MMFARKKEIKPLEQTYPEVAEKLHFDITQSVRDQIVSTPYRNAMAKYIAHKMAIERCERALERADLTPGQKVSYIQKIAEESKISEEAHTKIIQQLQTTQTAVQTLPEAVFEQIAVNLALAAPNIAEEKEIEVSISDQLLADAVDKNAIKRERQQQKEQEKTTKAEAKEFYTAQEESAKTLEANVDVEAMTQRTTQLDSVAVALEQQAKPSEEAKEVPKQVPADYEKAMVSKQLDRQLRESLSTDFTDEVGLQ